MTVLQDLVAALGRGAVEVVDLTAPLSATTPILALPDQFGQTWPFALTEISRYDDRGPAWYWNNISTGEHTGTHFDAPIHWVTGRDARRRRRRCRRARLIAPAAVHRPLRRRRGRPRLPARDRPRRGSGRPRTARCRPAAGCSTAPAGTRRGDDAGAYPTSGRTPGISVECAQWLAEEAPIQGVGVETVGTDAGAAHSFDPPFPCHSFLLGNDKYGLTQLRNLDRLPPTGAVVVAGPLPIVDGSGSPCRVLALVEP